MTLAPRDYIAERRRDISQRMEALKLELLALDRMESALAEGPLMTGKIPIAPAIPPPEISTPPPPAPPRRRRIEGGIKSIVMDVLAPMGAGKGMTAQEILVAMTILFGIEIPRTSLSPQLSRLREDGLVEVINSVWRATDKGREAYRKTPR